LSGKLQIGTIDLTGSEYGLRIGGVRPYQAVGTTNKGAVIPGRVGEVFEQDTVTIAGFSFPAWPNGLQNEIREYDAAIYMRNETAAVVEQRMTKIRKLLMEGRGGVTLRDSYEPGFFRKAYFYGDFQPTRKGAGQNFVFPLRFSCDPRRYIDGLTAKNVVTTEDFIPGSEQIPYADYVVDIAHPIITITGNERGITLNFRALPSETLYGKIDFVPFSGLLVVDTSDMIAQPIEAFTISGGPFIADIVGDPCLLPTGTRITRTIGDDPASITIEPRWWVR
jgi:hypothetical protein